jgi:hypothetical protein
MLRRYAPAAALLVAALLLPAGAGAHQAAKGVTTYGEIESLAMDGPLVAYDVGARDNINQRCNKLFAWNVRTGARKKISGKHTCDADSTSTGSGVAELAVAGKRIAWIVNQGGNTESYDDLYVSSWGHPRERRLAHAYRQGDVDSALAGTWIGGLVGSGSVLDVNRWTTDINGNVTKGKLQRIGRGLRTVAAGTDTVHAVATDAGRIAVLRSNLDIAVYSRSGSVISTVSPGRAKAVALSATTLAVLTEKNVLELYGISTGTLAHSWHLKHVGAQAGLGVHKGIAVWSTRNRVYATRLSTGKTVRIANAPKYIYARVALSASGAVYAYETFNQKTLKIHGHVVFVPMHRIRAAL